MLDCGFLLEEEKDVINEPCAKKTEYAYVSLLTDRHILSVLHRANAPQ